MDWDKANQKWHMASAWVPQWLEHCFVSKWCFAGGWRVSFWRHRHSGTQWAWLATIASIAWVETEIALHGWAGPQCRWCSRGRRQGSWDLRRLGLRHLRRSWFATGIYWGLLFRELCVGFVQSRFSVFSMLVGLVWASMPYCVEIKDARGSWFVFGNHLGGG